MLKGMITRFSNCLEIESGEVEIFLRSELIAQFVQKYHVKLFNEKFDLCDPPILKLNKVDFSQTCQEYEECTELNKRFKLIVD
jgi:hypothetical protein